MSHVISNESFSWYLTGLCDGESHFQLAIMRIKNVRYPRCEFNISLRSDEMPMLQRIKDFWQCGSIFFNGKVYNNRDGYKRSPMARYFLNNPRHLESVVVDHFLKYPMQAKKSRDFNLWKEGVSMLAREKDWGRWPEGDILRFKELISRMKEQRKYKSPTSDIPASVHVKDLFSDIAD